MLVRTDETFTAREVVNIVGTEKANTVLPIETDYGEYRFESEDRWRFWLYQDDPRAS